MSGDKETCIMSVKEVSFLRFEVTYRAARCVDMAAILERAGSLEDNQLSLNRARVYRRTVLIVAGVLCHSAVRWR